MTHVLCPGSFDPPTLGHLDVVDVATRLFDRVTVAVVINPAKTGLFTVPERLELLREVTTGWPGVMIDSFDGLLVDYCARQGIDAIVKGFRSPGDVEYEQTMAHMNAHLASIPTLLIPSAPEYSFVSSSLVKQVASYGGDVSALVSPVVEEALAAKRGR